MSIRKCFCSILLVFSTAIIVFAEEETTPIPLTQTNNGHNHDDIVPPVVEYEPTNDRLSITFESEDSYMVEVRDFSGHLMYSAPVVTTGVTFYYYVNLLDHHFYSVTITSSTTGFIGTFVKE